MKSEIRNFRGEVADEAGVVVEVEGVMVTVVDINILLRMYFIYQYMTNT